MRYQAKILNTYKVTVRKTKKKITVFFDTCEQWNEFFLFLKVEIKEIIRLVLISVIFIFGGETTSAIKLKFITFIK